METLGDFARGKFAMLNDVNLSELEDLLSFSHPSFKKKLFGLYTYYISMGDAWVGVNSVDSKVVPASVIFNRYKKFFEYNKNRMLNKPKDIHTDIQSLKDKYPEFNITVSVEEKNNG